MSNTRAISLWLVSLLICALAVLVTVSAYAQTPAPDKAAATAPADAKAADAPKADAPKADAPAAAPAAAAPAAAAAPTPNKGDTAWMLVATALVILMTIPGLALFYGGLVSSRSLAS